MSKIDGDLRVTGQILADVLQPTAGTVGDNEFNGSDPLTRAKLAQDAFAVYGINLAALRVWDAFQTVLPGTAASDDLGLTTGTFGTSAVTVRTSDAKATTVTQRARFLFTLPAEYDDGESVRIRIRGGMITTVSDGTATVDVECHEHNGDGAVGADLCTTAAQTINSLTKGNDDFTITSSGLVAGDQLEVRVTVAITDAATATAVIGEISKIEIHLDIRG